jgi:hypothetical protein
MFPFHRVIRSATRGSHPRTPPTTERYRGTTLSLTLPASRSPFCLVALQRQRPCELVALTSLDSRNNTLITRPHSIARPISSARRPSMLPYRHQTQAITHAITAIAVPKTPYRLLARCFVSGGRRTSALVRSVKGGAYRLRRGYASVNDSAGGGASSGADSKAPQSSSASAAARGSLFREFIQIV